MGIHIVYRKRNHRDGSRWLSRSSLAARYSVYGVDIMAREVIKGLKLSYVIDLMKERPPR